MLGRINKMLRNQKGFTLIELMTVLIILGVILGIGVPKYLQVQAKAEWEADASTIRNFAKAAETYVSSTNEFNQPVTIQDLIDAGLVAEEIVLNRVNSGTANKSKKNKGETGEESVGTKHGTVDFTFNNQTGAVKNLSNVIQEMIGNPPYGEGPDFPGDESPVVW